MKKPTFDHWRATTDRYFGTGPESPLAKVQAAYRKCARGASQQISDPSAFLSYVNHLAAETRWHRCGRPYYKVHHQVAEWLQNVSMNFPAEFFEVPFETFAIMLPSEFGLAGTFLVNASKSLPSVDEQQEYFAKFRSMKSRVGTALGEAISGYCDEKRATLDNLESRHGHAKLQLTFSWRDEDGVAHAHFCVYENMTLEQALEILDDQGDVAEMDASSPELAWERRRALIRLAVGVAAFATNKHDFVSPDVNTELLRSRFPGGRSKASQALAANSIAKEIAKCRGWHIGAEIPLPRPEYLRRDGERREGSQLEYSHARAGHLRMQPCGPGGKDRRLIFVPPCIVRSDLPMAPHRGFQLRDNVVPKSFAGAAQ